MPKTKLTDREIEELYDSGSLRLTQERSDFLLPQITDFVEKKRWMNLHPEYQRRLVWSRNKRSLFIESLLMNIPVLPVFLFEHDYNRYEVMDGQQRLSSIVDFYNNRYKLTGLEHWSPLNGKSYADCPPKIQRGLDRRRIAAVVLLAENITDRGIQNDIRRMVFERLNTGGQKLNAQELRNCIYSGPFAELLVKLAGLPLFNDIWDMPRYEDHIRSGHISSKLSENTLFRRMTDCEIALRFFAFRQRSKIRGAVKTILDRTMEAYSLAEADELEPLGREYEERLTVAHQIFGKNTFRMPDERKRRRLSRPLYDAVMIAIDRLFDDANALVDNRMKVRKALDDEFSDPDFYALLVGRANTAEAIKERLDRVTSLFRSFV